MTRQNAITSAQIYISDRLDCSRDRVATSASPDTFHIISTSPSLSQWDLFWHIHSLELL